MNDKIKKRISRRNYMDFKLALQEFNERENNRRVNKVIVARQKEPTELVEV